MRSYNSEGIVIIGDFTLSFLNIKEFYLWTNLNELLPRVSIKFYSKDFTNNNILFDGQIINIALAVASSNNHILNDTFEFSLTSFEISSPDSEGAKEIKIYAKMQTKYYVDREGISNNGTFTEMLSRLMRNDIIIEKDSSDKMVWRKYNESTVSFINKNLNRSWVANKDAPILYFDTYLKKYVYTSYKTALTRNVIKADYNRTGLSNSVIGPKSSSDKIEFSMYDVKDTRSHSSITSDGFDIYYITNTGESKNIKLERSAYLGSNTGKDKSIPLEKVNLNISYNPDLHTNYYIAPYNKQMIDNAILTNQLTIYIKPIEYLRILDVVEVNIVDNLISSGKYFVTAITYFVKDTNVYQIVTLSRDYIQEFKGKKVQVK